jgi:hypothetical protein
MTKKCFWAHVLPAMLLVAMPMFANAQNPNVGNLTPPSVIVTDGAGTHGAGVVIQPTGADAATVDYEAALPQYVTAAGQQITIGKVTLPATTMTYGTETTSAVTVFSNTAGASLDNTTITVGDISFADNRNTALFGFRYAVDDGAGTTTPFGGTLNLGNVEVTNNNVNTDSRAVGVSFTNAAGTDSADITGTVTVGDIKVTGNGIVGAMGFGAGGITGGGSVKLANVDVSASNPGTVVGFGGGPYAMGIGVGIIGDNNVTAPNGLESFSVDDITVEANGNDRAIGLLGSIIRTDGTLTVGDVKVTNTNAGVNASADGVSLANGAVNGKVKVGDITVTSNGQGNGSGFAAGALAAGGSVELGDVKVVAKNAATTPTGGAGGVYIGDIGDNNVTAPNGKESFTVKDITVDASTNGLVSGLRGDGIGTDGTLKVGDVKVTNASTGNNAFAEGVYLGANNPISGNVEVGDITVTSVGNKALADGFGSAYGFDTDAAITATAKVKVGNITVTSNGGQLDDAYGFDTTNIVAGASVELGDVNVTSAQGNAYGINLTAANNAQLKITNDVIAKTNAPASQGKVAVGINTVAAGLGTGSSITIDTKNGDVEISGIATNPTGNTPNVGQSIVLGEATDTLIIQGANKHTNKGKVFNVVGAENVRWTTDAEYNPISSFVTNNAVTTHQVATGKTVIIHGGVATGGGAYNVGSVKAAGNEDSLNAGTLVTHQLNTAPTAGTAGAVTVNSGVLAIDGGNAYNVGGVAGNNVIGQLTIGNAANTAPAAVAIYGNSAPGTVGLQMAAAPTVNTNAITDVDGEAVLSLSSITQYKLNGTTYVAQNRARAKLADGFLLPATIHSRLTGWEATRDHFISAKPYRKSSSLVLGQSECDPCEPVCEEPSCDPCDPCSSNTGAFGALTGSTKNSFWVNYIGRSSQYRSSYSHSGIDGNGNVITLANGDWKIGTDGVQLGLDLYKSSRYQLGLLLGFEGTVATLRSDRLEADDVYFGVYGARVFSNGADVRIVYNYGSQDYSLRRLDPGLNFDWHTHNSKFDGNTHEVSLELGKRLYSSRKLSYRPVIGFDLLVNDWDSALEDGNLTTAIAYDKASNTQAFLRFGSDLKYTAGRFELNSGLYYSYDLNGEILKTRVAARDNSARGYSTNINSTLYGSDLGRSVLTFNFGSSIALSGRCSVFGGFTGDAVLDRDGDGFQSIGYVGLKRTW